MARTSSTEGESRPSRSARARREHQCLAGARARSPGNYFADIAGFRSWPRGAHEAQDRIHHRFANRQPPHQALRGNEFIGAHCGLRLALFGTRGVEYDPAFRVTIRVVDIDLHQETIKLRLGKRVSPFLLNRVLGREHMKRAWNIVTAARNRDVLFLHRLQQRGLRARARAIDLVSHQELAEDRTGDKPEAAFTARTLLEHFAADNVRRHEIRGELNAACIEPQHYPHGLHELCLGKSGQSDQEGMATRQDGDQSLLDDAVLAKNHSADCRLGGSHLRPRRLRLAHNHVFELFKAFAGCCHYIASLLRPNRARLASLISKGCNIQANQPATFLDKGQIRISKAG